LQKRGKEEELAQVYGHLRIVGICREVRSKCVSSRLTAVSHIRAGIPSAKCDSDEL
jgi:hypothetical protein